MKPRDTQPIRVGDRFLDRDKRMVVREEAHDGTVTRGPQRTVRVVDVVRTAAKVENEATGRISQVSLVALRTRWTRLPGGAK